MQIDRTAGVPPHRIVNPEPGAGQPAASPVEPVELVERRDRIDLSAAARQAGQRPVADREALLRELRAQLAAGTYHFDASGVARRIVAREDL